MAAAIEIRGIVNRFGHQVVHDGLDVDIRAGEVFGIVGGSGSGKSVLLKCILGLMQPDSGSIKIEQMRDVIDRSQFPAAPGARAGGMAVHDFFAAVRRLAAEPRVRLIDLTEWDPPLDPTDLSALTAARWVAECLAGFEMRQT